MRTLDREECVRTGGGEGRRERGALRLANSADENNRSASRGNAHRLVELGRSGAAGQAAGGRGCRRHLCDVDNFARVISRK